MAIQQLGRKMKRAESRCIFKKHCFAVAGTRHEDDEQCCFCGFKRELNEINRIKGVDTKALLDVYDSLD
jgi:hypothetical protein